MPDTRETSTSSGSIVGRVHVPVAIPLRSGSGTFSVVAKASAGGGDCAAVESASAGVDIGSVVRGIGSAGSGIGSTSLGFGSESSDAAFCGGASEAANVVNGSISPTSAAS